MSAYVVVHLAPTRRIKQTRGRPAAHSKGSNDDALAHDKVKRLLAEHGAEVIPSSGANAVGDESATIACRDMACADRLAAALREMDGVETAYAKPGEELP